jgi:hypothetical protein
MQPIAVSSDNHVPQRFPGALPGYPVVPSSSTHHGSNFGGQVPPFEVSGHLQFSNGVLGPQAVGIGNWQQPPVQHMPLAPPVTPTNSAPYLRQGVPSLSSSSARVSQKLELPPLPRPLSTTTVAAEAHMDAAIEFKPAVYVPHLSLYQPPGHAAANMLWTYPGGADISPLTE